MNPLQAILSLCRRRQRRKVVRPVQSPPPTDAFGRTWERNPNGCGCHRCNPRAAWFVGCDVCGNKRCWHATDHRLKCTGTNDVIQPAAERVPAEPVPVAGGVVGSGGACGFSELEVIECERREQAEQGGDNNDGQ